MSSPVQKVLTKIKKNAERIINDATQRFPEAASPGDVFRQGDVYIQLLDAMPKDSVKDDKPIQQLAPGTTQGSRHILDSLSGVTMFKMKNPSPLQGPVLKTTKERTITHPQHGDCVIGPGIYNITYQRAYAEELRRQQD